jgi:chromosome segregation protein
VFVKSLTLKGFKSFATPTTFAFEPGVTAIVGPNGSGKSNVVDALAWVMGEQGAKTLRGGRMEDVIFAGTSQRGPLGRAEVMLTIDNSDGALPIEYTEVSIRRILFRSGASEYAINGRPCRLLDVQELLSDTGLGREMHVIVGQGRLDDVLRASPQERREFIEEAAGILKHRRRKERTLRKLDSMEANLTRVRDLTAELRRQLKPLGAQAETARAAQEIQASVRQARGQLLSCAVHQLQSKNADIQHRLQAAEAEERLRREELETLRSRQHGLEHGVRDPRVEEASQISFALQQTLQRAEALRDLAAQQVILLEAQPSAQASAEPMPDVAAAEADAADAQAVAERCRLDWEQSQRRTGSLMQQLEEADRQISAREAAIRSVELEASRAESRCESTRAARERGSAELQGAKTALRQAEERRAQAQSEQIPAPAGGQDDDLDERVAEARRAVRTAQLTRDAAREDRSAADSMLEAARSRASAFDLALSGGAGGSRGGRTPGALVADALHVQPGYERAIAAALGAAGEALLADSEDAAAVLLAGARTRSEELGVVVRDGAAPANPASGRAPYGGRWALEVCTPDPSVSWLLADVVLVERLPLSAPPESVTLVTPRGEVRRGPLIRIPGKSRTGRVELAAARDAAERETHRAGQQREKAVQALSAAEQRLREARETESALLEQIRHRDAESARRAQAAAQAAARLQSAEQEEVRLRRAVEARQQQLAEFVEAEKSAAEARDALAQAPLPAPLDLDREALVASLRAAQAEEMESRIRSETARQEATQRQQQTVETRERVLRLQRAREAAERAEALRRRRLEEARCAGGVLPAVLSAIRQDVSTAQEELGARKAEQAARDRELAALREQVSAAVSTQADAAHTVGAMRLEMHQNQMEREGVEERIRAQLSVEPSELLEEFPEGEDIEESAVRTELKRAERELRRLGSVNPLALEQFSALERRYEDMTGQLRDLEQTKRELLTLIEELDGRMEGIFESAFADTSAAFDRVLPLLFPGGSGRLVLTDSDGSAGVDVVLRPVGKKVDRLSLLSGGERSLAALAVLIAIFIARPSPFYIMDEVEAALDDANLGRLLGVFGELREGSQLIVITHQKRTMEIADALYGVSMRKDGVSAVVGQRLADRDLKEEA